MKNLKHEMKKVWDYIYEHPGILNYDLAKQMNMENFHLYAMLDALKLDNYLFCERRDSLLGGSYYWVYKIFPYE